MRLVPAPAHWQTQWQPRTSFRALFQHLALSVTKSEEPQDYQLKELQLPICNCATLLKALSCSRNTTSDIAVLFPSTYNTPRVPDSSRAAPRAHHPERNTAALFSGYQALESTEQSHKPAEHPDFIYAAPRPTRPLHKRYSAQHQQWKLMCPRNSSSVNCCSSGLFVRSHTTFSLSPVRSVGLPRPRRTGDSSNFSGEEN